MIRRILVATLMALALFVSAAHARRYHHEPVPTTLHSETACLRYADNQWYEEVGRRGCEHVGPHRERPITVTIYLPL